MVCGAWSTKLEYHVHNLKLIRGRRYGRRYLRIGRLELGYLFSLPYWMGQAGYTIRGPVRCERPCYIRVWHLYLRLREAQDV